ncbi:SARP family transcriptional regulator [Rhizocola hellebori]|uniref:SARP family transcriptional regulator n=1 Tax=Rhizocola hellebori TaxID=1392758 RepID=A0A8J3Q5D4_9ACTN|nr:BTAD domain-containing putative transcriptional regulator [Rhizocola hellebori]GIH03515.1 SARP family transcriptional regulator [Rhizocola hellebori]
MEFELLGPVRIVHNGQEVELRRRQERCLLCILLLENNHLVPDFRLLDLLWQGNPPQSGRATLHTYIARLRQAIGPLGVSLLRKGDGYLIETDPANIDVHRFTAGLAVAAAETAAAERLSILDRILPLWRGPLMADIADEDLRRRLDNGLQARHDRALELRAKTNLELGRYEDATRDARGVLSAHPAHEGAAEVLMTALYHDGRKADALEAFRQLRQRLADELGLDPSPGLQALHTNILKDDVGAKSAAPLPRELPAAVPGFNGRQAMLKELDSLLQGGNAAIIAGLAGVGKTALAVHWAHRVAESFPDGQLYLDLRGYSETAPMKPLHALTTLLGKLGVQAVGVPTDINAAAALFRSLVSGRRMLLLLDDARSAEQIRPLLPGSQTCFVVVTSRDRLSGLVAREGVRRLTLEVLTEPESLQLLADMLGSVRVTREPQAAKDLAGLCGRLPLALRIAAARLADNPHQTLGDEVAEMRAKTSIAGLTLTGEPGVSAAFDLSYQALPETAKLVFRQLGLINLPDYTADSASSLAAISKAEAASALESLAAAHLLTQHRPGRFTMHDLLWQYAKSRSGDPAEGLKRLFDAYLATVPGAVGELYPDFVRLPYRPDSVTAPQNALGWFDAERANLTTLILHAARNGPHDAAWLLADCMLPYLDQRHIASDRMNSARAAVAAARRYGDAQAQAAAYQVLAHATVGPNRPSRWITYINKAISSASEAGWGRGEAAMRTNLALMLQLNGRAVEALAQANAALAQHERSGWGDGRQWTMNIAVEIYGTLGRAQEGLDLAIEAANWLEDQPKAKARGRVLAAQAEMHVLLGDFDLAIDRATAALKLFRTLDHHYYEAHTLLRLCEAHLGAGDAQLARQAAERSLELSESFRNAWLKIDILNTLAAVELAQGHAEPALRHRQDALEIAETVPYQYMLTATQIGLAEVHCELQELEIAKKYAERALAQCRQSGYRLLEERLLRLDGGRVVG